MASFDEFYRSLPEDSNKRGEYFEKVFVPWFLKTDPVWATKVSHIWLWDDPHSIAELVHHLFLVHVQILLKRLE